MTVTDTPMPPAIAARPRDRRGFPVPAITPWAQGEPQFGLTGVARTFLCAVERRCSVCGTTMAPGPVYRVVGGAEATAIETALADGRAFRNAAPTAEAPGHRACLRYATVVCPWLSQATARRGHAVAAPAMPDTLLGERGTRRGPGGAVVGYRTYDFTYSASEGVLFRFGEVVAFSPYGQDPLPTDHPSPDDARDPDDGTAPAYLGPDEALAEAAFTAYRQTLLG